MRKTIQVILKDESPKGIILDEEHIKSWLGYSQYKKTSLSAATDHIGLVTGLAWTEMGGDVLEIEASVVNGKGGLALTGQLGDVMQESAHAALSYIRSKAELLGLPASFHSTKDIHLHIPEGATPKDGPSAGITICVALISALTKKKIKSHLALTGEITLRGRVLAVGGLKEKILAAQQHGITTVILPQENYDDILDFKKDLNDKNLNLVFVDTMDQVLEAAFVDSSFNSKKTKAAVKKSANKAANTRKKTVKSKKTSV